MIKYVFWDFNGTILDDLQLCLDLLNELLKSEDKKPLNLNEYLEIFGFPVKEYYLRAGITFQKNSFEEMAKWFIKIYQPASLKLKLHKNVVKTLKNLKKLQIVNICLSASNQENLEEQLQTYKISKYFQTILGTDNIHALGKKDKALKFISNNKINPKECLLIGDTISDYEIAKELKIKSVLYTKGHQSIKRLKETESLLINDIYDIIKIVNKQLKG